MSQRLNFYIINMFKIEQRKYRTEVETNFFAIPLLAYNSLYFVALLFFFRIIIRVVFPKKKIIKEREREREAFNSLGWLAEMTILMKTLHSSEPAPEKCAWNNSSGLNLAQGEVCFQFKYFPGALKSYNHHQHCHSHHLLLSIISVMISLAL